MKQRQQDFALGVTALVFLALFLGTILFLYPLFHARGNVIAIQFPHEQGMAPLSRGSLVRLGGALEVGRVIDVQIATAPNSAAPDTQQTVFLVSAEIDADVDLYGNCRITTDQPAIGGDGFLTILSVGTPDVPLAQPIAGLPPQSFQAAIGTLSRELLAEGGLVDHLTQAVDPNAVDSAMHKVLAILDNLRAMTAELHAQLSPTDERALLRKFHQTLDNLTATTAALRSELAAGDNGAMLAKVHVALDRLSTALGDAQALITEDRPLIKETLTSVASAARTLDGELLGNLRDELDADNPASLIAKVHVAMDQVNASLGNVQELTRAGERLLKANRPKLEQTLTNLESTSAHLEHAALKILMNPRALMVGTPPHRDDQLLVFQAARSFAQAATDLDQAAGRFEAILDTVPPDGVISPQDAAELQQIYSTIRATFEHFERTEEALWQEMK